MSYSGSRSVRAIFDHRVAAAAPKGGFLLGAEPAALDAFDANIVVGRQEAGA